MSRVLYRTHTRAPERGTLWEDDNSGHFYRVTRTKWYAGVGIVYGKPATTAAAIADAKAAFRDLGQRILDTLPVWR